MGSEAAAALDALVERIASFERVAAPEPDSWTQERALGVLGQIAAFGHERWLTEMTLSIGAMPGDVVAESVIAADSSLRADLDHAQGDDDRIVSKLDQHAALSLAMGRPDDARTALRVACSHVTRLFGPDHTSMPGRLAQLAMAHVQLREWTDGESALTDALVAMRRTHGSAPSDVLDAVERSLDALEEAGEREMCDRVRAMAHAELSARLGIDHPWLTRVFGR